MQSALPLAEYGFVLAMEIANRDKLPDWCPGDPVLQVTDIYH
jgi:hypothetical protein